MQQNPASPWIRFNNGLSLRLATARGQFLGIGEVRAGRTQLRNPRLPWTLYAESEHGLRFEDFRLQRVTRGPAVIWAFQDVKLPCPGTATTADGKRVDTAQGMLAAKGQAVYLLGDGSSGQHRR
jgi:hypothetical protein